MEANNSSVGVIVGIVLALAVGLGGGYLIGNGMEKSDKTVSDSQTTSMEVNKPGALNVTLDGLLREHVSTSLAVTRTIVDGESAEKLAGAQAAQTANAVGIAKAVGSIYGEDAQKAITTPFVEHITNSNNYAKAVAASDDNAKAMSLSALQANLRQVADVFHSVMPSVSSDALYDALNAHEALINQSTEAYQAGDYTKAYELESEALTQISGGAIVLTNGIVTSKPNMFK